MGLTLDALAVLDLSRKRSMAAVQLVGLAAAVALAVSLALMQSVAAERGLRSALSSLGAGANLQIGLDQVNELPARRLLALAVAGQDTHFTPPVSWTAGDASRRMSARDARVCALASLMSVPETRLRALALRRRLSEARRSNPNPWFAGDARQARAVEHPAAPAPAVDGRSTA
jgi:hypothetical protein